MISGLILSALGAGALQVVWAAPEPSPVRVAWELQCEPSVPQRILVETTSGKQVYWYMLYTVVNNTPEDVDFHPEIVRVSEVDSEVPEDQAAQMADKAASLTLDHSIVGLDKKIFEAIKNLHAKTHPFLTHPVDAIGKLRQGKDNALTAVAVFKEMDPRVNKFTIYFSGLSGEQESKPNPAYDAKKPVSDKNTPVFVLRKTLAIPYVLPGDERTRLAAEPSLGRMEWVMR